MKLLKKPILIACLAALTVLAVPTVSSAAEIQINGQKAAAGSELEANGYIALNTSFLGQAYKCNSLRFFSKIAKNEHFDVGPYTDYGFFNLEAPKQIPYQAGCADPEGGNTQYSEVQFSIVAPSSGTTYNSTYIGGPNRTSWTGDVKVRLVASHAGGAKCTWTGTEPIKNNYFSSGELVLGDGIKRLTSVGGCGAASIEAKFRFQAKLGSTLVPVTFR